MRNDQLFTELTNLPFNAAVSLTVFDSNGFEYGYEATGVEYDAHTNTIIIRGV